MLEILTEHNTLGRRVWRCVALLWAALLLLPCVATAQSHGVIRTAEAGKDGDSMAVVITLNPEMLEMADRNTLTITPCIAAEGDTVTLPSIHVMGRVPYYRYVRHDDMGLPVMPGDNVVMEVELIVPVALEKGSKFAIREGGLTVGAGTVTEIIA